MIIDKINLKVKIIKQITVHVCPSDKEWLAKVDNVKTFDDVVKL